MINNRYDKPHYTSSPAVRTLAFQNPQNGHIEEAPRPGLWSLLFGPLYFAYKGAWAGFLIAFAAGLLTFGISHFVVPFFARALVRHAYLGRGWTIVSG